MRGLWPRRREKGLLLLFLPLLFLFVFTAAARAEVGEDPFVILAPEGGDEKGTEDVILGALQDRLSELGYFSGNRSFLYDVETQYAVLDFCTTNGLEYSPEGIRRSVWDRIMSEDAIPAVQEVTYADLVPGAAGEAVLALQTRLKELNYYDGGLILTPEYYDADTQTAVERFCETNSISYTGSGASAALQQIIFSEGAAEYTLPEISQDFSEKTSSYMMRDVAVAGVNLPMFVLWIIAALLLMLLLAVIVHFFVRDSKNRAAENTRTSPAILAGRPAQAAERPEQPRAADAGRMLSLQIEYLGNVRNERLDCSDGLVIGRGSGTLQLDKNDFQVSRSHCELHFKGAVLMLRDHSTNGTTRNGTLIHNSECRVNSGDTLGVGAHSISIQF